jgi:ribosome-associated protein
MDTETLIEWVDKTANEDFSRSSGPGGQNVNKVSTKVVLRIPIDELPVSDAERQGVRERLSNRINSDGELVIQSSETRSQSTNRQRARERAAHLIAKALRRRPERRRTRPSKAQKERRLDEKRRRGDTKRMRRDPSH